MINPFFVTVDIAYPIYLIMIWVERNIEKIQRLYIKVKKILGYRILKYRFMWQYGIENHYIGENVVMEDYFERILMFLELEDHFCSDIKYRLIHGGVHIGDLVIKRKYTNLITLRLFVFEEFNGNDVFVIDTDAEEIYWDTDDVERSVIDVLNIIDNFYHNRFVPIKSANKA